MFESGMTLKMAETVAQRQIYAPVRRQMLRGLGVMAMAGLLAACQVVPKSSGPATPPPPTNPDDSVGPGLPTDTDRHRVALLVPQTGANADVGTAIANATTLALLDSRTERVRIPTYDTALGAAAAARQAVADGNKLILGPLLSEDVTAVAPIERAAKVPVLCFSNDSGGLRPWPVGRARRRFFAREGASAFRCARAQECLWRPFGGGVPGGGGRSGRHARRGRKL